MLEVKRIGIEAMAGVTDVGDLKRVWDLWLAGERQPKRDVESDVATDDWRGRTSRCMEELLRGFTQEERGRFGLVLGTTKGDLGSELAWKEARSQEPGARRKEGLPTLGSEAGRLAGEQGLGGMTWAVSTACSSGLMALIEAAMAVRDGDAQGMVAMGADDVNVGESFVRDGFRALKAVSVKGCRPFDIERDGLMLGSAAAGCVVGATERGKAMCEILGWGVSNDATHMTAPDREAGGLVRAMRGSLAMAGIGAADVDVVFAHGTGTVYNDAMEAVAIEKVFLRDGGKGPAVTGVKGLIGHTLGASGMVEAMLAVRMIQEGRVPGMYGLKTPERGDLDLVRATRKMEVRRVMKVASGFGGMNAAVILGEAGS